MNNLLDADGNTLFPNYNLTEPTCDNFQINMNHCQRYKPDKNSYIISNETKIVHEDQDYIADKNYIDNSVNDKIVHSNNNQDHADIQNFNVAYNSLINNDTVNEKNVINQNFHFSNSSSNQNNNQNNFQDNFDITIMKSISNDINLIEPITTALVTKLSNTTNNINNDINKSNQSISSYFIEPNSVKDKENVHQSLDYNKYNIDDSNLNNILDKPKQSLVINEDLTTNLHTDYTVYDDINDNKVSLDENTEIGAIPYTDEDFMKLLENSPNPYFINDPFDISFNDNDKLDRKEEFFADNIQNNIIPSVEIKIEDFDPIFNEIPNSLQYINLNIKKSDNNTELKSQKDFEINNDLIIPSIVINDSEFEDSDNEGLLVNVNPIQRDNLNEEDIAINAIGSNSLKSVSHEIELNSLNSKLKNQNLNGEHEDILNQYSINDNYIGSIDYHLPSIVEYTKSNIKADIIEKSTLDKANVESNSANISSYVNDLIIDSVNSLNSNNLNEFKQNNFYNIKSSFDNSVIMQEDQMFRNNHEDESVDYSFKNQRTNTLQDIFDITCQINPNKYIGYYFNHNNYDNIEPNKINDNYNNLINEIQPKNNNIANNQLGKENEAPTNIGEKCNLTSLDLFDNDINSDLSRENSSKFFVKDVPEVNSSELTNFIDNIIMISQNKARLDVDFNDHNDIQQLIYPDVSSCNNQSNQINNNDNQFENYMFKNDTDFVNENESIFPKNTNPLNHLNDKTTNSENNLAIGKMTSVEDIGYINSIFKKDFINLDLTPTQKLANLQNQQHKSKDLHEVLINEKNILQDEITLDSDNIQLTNSKHADTNPFSKMNIIDKVLPHENINKNDLNDVNFKLSTYSDNESKINPPYDQQTNIFANKQTFANSFDSKSMQNDIFDSSNLAIKKEISSIKIDDKEDSNMKNVNIFEPNILNAKKKFDKLFSSDFNSDNIMPECNNDYDVENCTYEPIINEFVSLQNGSFSTEEEKKLEGSNFNWDFGKNEEVFKNTNMNTHILNKDISDSQKAGSYSNNFLPNFDQLHLTSSPSISHKDSPSFLDKIENLESNDISKLMNNSIVNSDYKNVYNDTISDIKESEINQSKDGDILMEDTNFVRVDKEIQSRNYMIKTRMNETDDSYFNNLDDTIDYLDDSIETNWFGKDKYNKNEDIGIAHDKATINDSSLFYEINSNLKLHNDLIDNTVEDEIKKIFVKLPDKGEINEFPKDVIHKNDKDEIKDMVEKHTHNGEIKEIKDNFDKNVKGEIKEIFVKLPNKNEIKEIVNNIIDHNVKCEIQNIYIKPSDKTEINKIYNDNFDNNVKDEIKEICVKLPHYDQINDLRKDNKVKGDIKEIFGNNSDNNLTNKIREIDKNIDQNVKKHSDKLIEDKDFENRSYIIKTRINDADDSNFEVLDGTPANQKNWLGKDKIYKEREIKKAHDKTIINDKNLLDEINSNLKLHNDNIHNDVKVEINDILLKLPDEIVEVPKDSINNNVNNEIKEIFVKVLDKGEIIEIHKDIIDNNVKNEIKEIFKKLPDNAETNKIHKDFSDNNVKDEIKEIYINSPDKGEINKNIIDNNIKSEIKEIFLKLPDKDEIKEIHKDFIDNNVKGQIKEISVKLPDKGESNEIHKEAFDNNVKGQIKEIFIKLPDKGETNEIHKEVIDNNVKEQIKETFIILPDKSEKNKIDKDDMEKIFKSSINDRNDSEIKKQLTSEENILDDIKYDLKKEDLKTMEKSISKNFKEEANDIFKNISHDTNNIAAHQNDRVDLKLDYSNSFEFNSNFDNIRSIPVDINNSSIFKQNLNKPNDREILNVKDPDYIESNIVDVKGQQHILNDIHNVNKKNKRKLNENDDLEFKDPLTIDGLLKNVESPLYYANVDFEQNSKKAKNVSFEADSNDSISSRKKLMPKTNELFNSFDLENSDLNITEQLNQSIDSHNMNVPPQKPARMVTVDMTDEKLWQPIDLDGKIQYIDMNCITPYKSCLAHGGQDKDGKTIVVFAACYLPDKSLNDYNYILNNLFLYIMHIMGLLIIDDYIIVYFHGCSVKSRVPNLTWLKQCFDTIDIKLKKHLKALYVVHPNFYFKMVFFFMRPFIRLMIRKIVI